jgi:two-component system chemotaxis response regulator CheB
MLRIPQGQDVMSIRVLVVDDSRFFCRRLCEILSSDPEIEVVDTAMNGQEAIDKTIEFSPDLVTMDYAMPMMDGIQAVRGIMERRPTPILMLSSMTSEGTQVTLDSLEAGAVDFIAKDSIALAGRDGAQRADLISRVKGLASSNFRARRTALAHGVGTRSARPVTARSATKRIRLVVIGASTGGPVAVQKILQELPATFSAPIVVAIHMPQTFTGIFAERLNQSSKLKVKEAAEGDLLRSGEVLLAPGNKILSISGQQGGCIHLNEPGRNDIYSPSVDHAFSTAAQAFPGSVLGVVLTGMGQDGLLGAKQLKESHSRLWAQDQASSVIYGMPMAVSKANLVDHVYSLAELSEHLVAEVC